MVAGLAGCASTQKLSTANQVQSRYDELTKQSDAKDKEIAELNDKIQSLTDEVNKKWSPSSANISAATDENYKKDGIIRVDVSPHKVQLALQNAGYYNGPIDGKVGAGTKKAISAFQKANSLNPDGILGRKTWDTLKTHLN